MIRLALKNVEEATQDVTTNLDDKSLYIEVMEEIVLAAHETWMFGSFRDSSSEIRPPWTRRTLEKLVAEWSGGSRFHEGWRSPIPALAIRILALPRNALSVFWIAVPHGPHAEIRRVAWRIGATGFVKLLVTKGQYHELLDERESRDANSLRIFYQPRFPILIPNDAEFGVAEEEHDPMPFEEPVEER